eukprot:734-Eustigmatos_ZCMA.PRE.1
MGARFKCWIARRTPAEWLFPARGKSSGLAAFAFGQLGKVCTTPSCVRVKRRQYFGHEAKQTNEPG